MPLQLDVRTPVCMYGAQQLVPSSLVIHIGTSDAPPSTALVHNCGQQLTSSAGLVVAASAAASGIRLVRGEVDKLDKRAADIQGNVADVASVLVWQYNAGCIALSVAWKGTGTAVGPKL